MFTGQKDVDTAILLRVEDQDLAKLESIGGSAVSSIINGQDFWRMKAQRKHPFFDLEAKYYMEIDWRQMYSSEVFWGETYSSEHRLSIAMLSFPDEFFWKFACETGSLQLVKLMAFKSLQKRGSVDMNKGLNAAVEYGRIEVVRFLVERMGVSPFFSGFEMACRHNQLEVLRYIHSVTKQRASPMIFQEVLRSGLVDIVEFLLKESAVVGLQQHSFHFMKAAEKYPHIQQLLEKYRKLAK